MINRLYKTFVYDNDEVLMTVDYNATTKIHRQVAKTSHFTECLETSASRYLSDRLGQTYP